MLVEMEGDVGEKEEEQVQVVVEEKGEASVHWRLAHSSGESHQACACAAAFCITIAVDAGSQSGVGV
jgi:hypothetical protein